MDLNRFKKQLDEICRENGVAMLGVFGSVARGEDDANSDIDLLIKLKQPIGLIKFIQLEDKFVDLLGRKVDLVTEGFLHPKIKDNAMKDFKLLYEES
jgi:predicted nucleotidyltransferase